MNNGTPSSPSDSEMASKIKNFFLKFCHSMFDKKMKINCLSLIMDEDDHNIPFKKM